MFVCGVSLQFSSKFCLNWFRTYTYFLSHSTVAVLQVLLCYLKLWERLNLFIPVTGILCKADILPCVSGIHLNSCRKAVILAIFVINRRQIHTIGGRRVGNFQLNRSLARHWGNPAFSVSASLCINWGHQHCFLSKQGKLLTVCAILEDVLISKANILPDETEVD